MLRQSCKVLAALVVAAFLSQPALADDFYGTLVSVDTVTDVIEIVEDVTGDLLTFQTDDGTLFTINGNVVNINLIIIGNHSHIHTNNHTMHADKVEQ